MKEKIIIVTLTIILLILLLVYLFIPTPSTNNTKLDINTNKTIKTENEIAIYLDNNLSIKKEEVYNEGKLIDIDIIIDKINKKIIKDKYQELYNSKELQEKAEERKNDLLKDYGGVWNDIVTYFTGVKNEEEYMNNYKYVALEQELAKDYYISTLSNNSIKEYYNNISGEIKIICLYFKKELLPGSDEWNPQVNNTANNILAIIENSPNKLEKIKEYQNIYQSNISSIKTNDNKKELIKAIISINDNTLYDKLIETYEGYYIVYRISRTKMKYDKNKILDEMVNLYCKDSEGEYYYASFNYLRKQYNMKINIQEIEEKYNKYIKEKEELMS